MCLEDETQLICKVGGEIEIAKKTLIRVPLTGGAILGDRIRIDDEPATHDIDRPTPFVRSLRG